MGIIGWIFLYLSIAWILTGIIIVGSIVWFVWYNGYDIITTDVVPASMFTLYGPILLYMILKDVRRFGLEETLQAMCYTANDYDRIFLGGRKSPKVIRILSE